MHRQHQAQTLGIPLLGFWIGIFFCLASPKQIVAQEKAPQKLLNSKGYFTPEKKNTLYPTQTKIETPEWKATDSTIKSFRKTLLTKIEQTIFNLQDDSTGLKDAYTQIWGVKFYTDYLHDLKVLSYYLDSGTKTNYTLTFLPPIDTIKKIETTNPYIIDPEGKIDEAGQKKTFELYKKDLLKEQLLKSYKVLAAKEGFVTNSKIDSNYLTDWRKIEKWFRLTLETEKKIIELKNDIFNLDDEQVEKTKSEINQVKPESLELVKWVKSSDFIRLLLWQNAGAIRINPLPSTQPHKRYPNPEINSFFSPTQKKLQDSLEKLDAYKEFTTSKKLYNKIVLPVGIQTNPPDTLMIQYDISSGDKPLATIKDKFLKNKVQLLLPVYNIPDGKLININTDKKQLDYESSTTTVLNTMAGELAMISSLGLSNTATISKITDMLNKQPLEDIAYTINSVTPNSTKAIESSELNSIKSIPFPTSLLTIKALGSGGDVKSVKIKGVIVRLTNKDLQEDKKRILWTIYHTSQDVKKQNSNNAQFNVLMEEFVKTDKYLFLDYTSEGNIEKDIQEMTNRFNNFKRKIQTIANSISEIEAINSSNKMRLLPYVKITHRSLPPLNLTTRTDTVPSFTSKIFTPEMPTAPQKMIYTLSETQRDNGKTKVVSTETFKVINTQRFDLSAGLGYTFNNYNVSGNSGSDLPTTEAGEKFQFQAGLHIYIFKRLNKLNDKFFRNTNERFSIYLGLSLKKALDNYFTGLSYDLTPGVRLIAGAHFYKNQRFVIINNSVADKASGISAAGFFTLLNIEPVTIGKAIGLFK